MLVLDTMFADYWNFKSHKAKGEITIKPIMTFENNVILNKCKKY